MFNKFYTPPVNIYTLSDVLSGVRGNTFQSCVWKHFTRLHNSRYGPECWWGNHFIASLQAGVYRQ